MEQSVLIKKEKIEEALAQAPKQGKNLIEPFKSFAEAHNLPIKVLEDCEITNESEVHEDEGDLWQCVEGEVQFVYGGTLENPAKHPTKPGEWKGTGVIGGTEITLKLGDWLWIPAGEPHQHSAAGTARMLIIKIPRKK